MLRRILVGLEETKYFVILSGAKNLSCVSGKEKQERFFAPLGS
jgi:hypothetical protein